MSTKAQALRLEHIDALRGLAVVLMIWMHTADGWLAAEFRSGQLWALVRALGGMAAPLFLLLAGVSLGLRWATPTQRPWQRVGSDVGRGLQIVVLGYLLRLQMWIVDGGGYSSAAYLGAAVPLLAGYLALFFGLAELGNRPRRTLLGLLVGLPLWGLGIHLVSQVLPSKLEGLLRVDVLQAIGGSLAIVSVLGVLCSGLTGRHGRLLALGALTAAATPLMRSWVPGGLPEPVAGYLAYWDPGPGRAAASFFPLFPWMSYVFVGAALGRQLQLAAREGRGEDQALVLCFIGALLALASYEAHPHMRQLLGQFPWLTQPMRVSYRIGLALSFGGLAVALSRPALLRWSPLQPLGKASLLVYWVHLEFAFGLAAKPVGRNLSPSNWLVGLAVLIAAMTLVAWLRVRMRTASTRRRAIAERSSAATETLRATPS